MAERKIVTLVGRRRDWRLLRQAERDETTSGNIVLTVGCLGPDGAGSEAHDEEMVRECIALHFDKIRLADEVLVVSYGAVGKHTQDDIEFAVSLGKPVRHYTRERPAPAVAERPDLEAQERAKRHVEHQEWPGVDVPSICGFCRQPWPCDAAGLWVALCAAERRVADLERERDAANQRHISCLEAINKPGGWRSERAELRTTVGQLNLKNSTLARELGAARERETDLRNAAHATLSYFITSMPGAHHISPLRALDRAVAASQQAAALATGEGQEAG